MSNITQRQFLNLELLGLFFLIVLALFILEAGAAGSHFSTGVTPTVYPHLLDPTVYPDYSKRDFSIPMWDVFDNQMQFVVKRGMPDSSYVATVPGRVFHPGLWHVQRPDFYSWLDVMDQRDDYLFNIGGYGPGSYIDGHGFGQYKVTDEMLSTIRQKLEEKFLGFDIGEQDGRYNFVYEKVQEPFVADEFSQYLQAHRYIGQVGDDLGNIMAMLSVTWLWHYPMQDGNVIIAGVEGMNKTTNCQIHYSFLRGAGKQYGIPLFGNVSVFNTWNYKKYPEPGHESTDGRFGPTKGNSLNLMKRFLYTYYQYNCSIFGFEESWYSFPSGAEHTPIGRIHNAAVDFVSRNPSPGAIHTPVAVMLDFMSGWMPARHWRGSYITWNNLPYEKGDYLTHNVMRMLYNDYEDSSWYENEHGALSDTPYGDMSDSLLTDVSAEVMGLYGVIVAAGDLLGAGQELRDKVDEYVSGGGTFIVTGENARRLWPEWKVGASQKTASAGGTVTWMADGHNESETYAWRYYTMDIPAGAKVLAKYGSDPVAVKIPRGSGAIVVLLSPFGQNRDAQSYSDPGNPYWNPNKPLGRPYLLLKYVRNILDEYLASQKLFSVGDNLGYITNCKGPGEYTVGIYNNSLSSKPFQIVSHIGSITDVTELDLGTSVKDEVGYWPEKYQNNDGGLSDASHISGGDVRLFRVRVNEVDTRILSKVQPAAFARNRAVAIPEGINLKERLLGWPTFFQNFNTVKLDWQSLLAMDIGRPERENDLWLKRKKVSYVIDLSSGIESGELTLKKDTSEGSAYLTSVEVTKGILARMTELSNANHIIVCLDDVPAGQLNEVIEGLQDLALEAMMKGVMVHVKHHDTAWADDIADTLGVIDSAGMGTRFALNTADASGDSSRLASMMTQAGNRLGAILITPDSTGSAMDYSAVRSRTVLQVLDAEYSNWDDIYRDSKTAWKQSGPSTLRGKLPAKIVSDKFNVQAGNEKHILALHNIVNLRQAILAMPDFFKFFGGVKIDSVYLSSRDKDQCARDKQWLDEKGLKVVVDFSRRINGYPDLTFIDKVEHAYDESVAVMDDVLDKMQALGSKEAIICTHMKPEANVEETKAYSLMKQGINDFCNRAAQRGLTVHIQHNLHRKWASPSRIKTMIGEIAAKDSNLKMAINTNHDTDLSGLISMAGSDLGLIILGRKGSNECDLHTPIHLGGVNISPLTGRTEMQILDGGYSGWADIAADCSYLGWQEQSACGGKVPVSDISGDGFVDVYDLYIFAYDWLDSGEGLVADVDGDCDVNLNDFSFLAEDWMEQSVLPELLNGSFELPDVANYMRVVPEHWTWVGGTQGIQDGGVLGTGQRIYCNEPNGTLKQTLAATALGSSDYELSFYTGSSNVGTYQVIAKIVFDGTIVASKTIVPDPGQSWQKHSITYHSTLADVGSVIKIEFQYSVVVPGVQSWLDEVELTVTRNT